MKNVMQIAGMSFDSYIARRLRKDSLGFIPCGEVMESCTDIKNYIKSPIPKCQEDVLAYLHELGHCKSKQVKEHFGIFGFGYRCATPITIQNEVNAWDWALRYASRIGVKISPEKLQDFLDKTLGSYLSNVRQEALEEVKKIVHNFNNKFLLDVRVKDKTKLESFGFKFDKMWFDDIASPKKFDEWTTITSFSSKTVLSEKPQVVEKKDKKWKPWHDIVRAKNCKYFQKKGNK